MASCSQIDSDMYTLFPDVDFNCVSRFGCLGVFDVLNRLLNPILSYFSVNETDTA